MTAVPARSTSAPLRHVPRAMPAADTGTSGHGSTDPWKDPDVARAPRPGNPVILALVVALRDVEVRRGRGKVLTHLTSKRPAA
jgi:hypothetical protein